MTKPFRFTRRLGSALLAAFVLVAVPACNDKSSDAKSKSAADDDEGDGPTEVAKVMIDEVRDLVKKGKPISAEQYEKLILAHANCEVTDGGIDSKCEAVTILRESMNRSQLAKDVLGGNAGLGQKLIGHSSPAVRIKAAEMMASLFGSSDKSRKVVVDAARKEKHPAVLTAMIRTIRNDGAKHADVGKLLLDLADHDDPKIRKEAVFGLSSTWNRNLAGGPEKLIAMMEGDKDPEVRSAACEHAGKLGDAKLFVAYEKLLKNRSNGKLWGDCFEGLVEMWASYPFFDNANQQAYALTIQLLESTPRNKEIPPWTAMSDFGHLGSTTNDKLEAWKKKATWYQPEALKKALAAVVADPNAYWMARTSAVEALVKLGASKGELQTLRTPLGSAPSGDGMHVAKALDKALAK